MIISNSVLYGIGVFVWIVGFLVSYPALFADLQHAISDVEFAKKRYRKDLGVSMFYALIPPMWIATPFVTGFYQHGFKFK